MGEDGQEDAGELDFDQIKGLSNREEQVNLTEGIEGDHKNLQSQINQTEQSEFRNLPQLDSFDSGNFEQKEKDEKVDQIKIGNTV